MNAFIDDLALRLRRPLPGHEAQYRLAHQVRRNVPPPPPDARRAGVLALFYPRDNDWHIVLIERMSGHPNDRHAGQIGFPGGAYEAGDGTLERTALREAYEEVGAPWEEIQVLGELTQLYIPVSNFLVFPFVGRVNYTPVFTPQAAEVRAVLEVPFSAFRHPEALRTRDMELANGSLILRDVPYFDIDGKVVWGATAMILSELLAVMEDMPGL